MTNELDLDVAEVEFRRRRIARFPHACLIWLAALPEWTDRLADAAGFPAGPDPLPVLLGRLDAAGLLGRRADVDGDGEPLTAFWLPASRRAEVGAHLRAIVPPAVMATALRELADALSGLPGDGFRWWLLVLDRHGDDPSGVELLDEVEQLISAARSEEALALTGAAHALGDLLGEPLASSARRIQWRIDRGHRQALDASTVVHYLPHPDVEATLRELVAGDGSTWAVHLLGDGGVGKTMAIRDLSSGRLAARWDLPQPPVARIDFDHLDPRYPYGRPGELLLALVGELFTYSSSRETESAFRASDDALAHLHETVTSPAADGADPGLLDEAVTAFAAYLRDLGGVVVLVLDTCEELAKLHPPGGRAPAVDRTFDLLERLHELAPSMRVVLAGRRWLVPTPDGRSSGGLVLEPRPYLRIVELAGFTAGQARAYVDLRDPERRVPGPLREALLERCATAGGPHTNPYDLACYCTWVLADPALDPGILRDARGDPYVEQRILARVPSSEVRDCLPAAVELGRFDRTMIEPVLVRRGIDADIAFSDLVGQEWVSAVTFDDDGRPRVIEVDEQLRPRLRAVLAAQPDRFPHDPDQLGRDLHAVIAATPVQDLAVEAVEAALRLLPVAEAGSMWSALVRRIADTGGWDWALHATARAAAAEAPRAEGGGPTVQGAILAAQAAAQLRLPARPGLGPLWRQVLALADRFPEPAARPELELRALCGSLGGPDPVPGALDRIVELCGAHPELPADPLVAALDALAATGAAPAVSVAAVLDRLRDHPAPEIAAAASLAEATVLIGHDDLDGAAASVQRALRISEADAVGGARADWPDWIPPRHPLLRARLARVVLAAARCEPPRSLPLAAWRAEAFEQVAEIDAERLAAATITLELDWGTVDRVAVIEQAMAADTYLPERAASHFWHHVVPPLCVAIARALAAAGEASTAGRWLRRRRDDGVASGEDAATIDICNTELAVLSRRFRSSAFTTSLGRLARQPASADAAWTALLLVQGRRPATVEEAGGPRTWWRTRTAADGGLAVPAGTSPVAHLDRLEATLMADPAGSGRLAARIAVRELAARPHRPLLDDPADLGALLRSTVLLDPPAEVETAISAQPPRHVGEIAMAEGELLALRLPGAGADLLERARDAFVLVGDALSAAHAAGLHVLAVARAGRTLDSSDPGLAKDRTALSAGLPDGPERSGWPARLDRARQLLDGEPFPAPPLGDTSPELAPMRAESAGGAEATAPKSFGRFRLEGRTVQGGMGVTFRAYDTTHERMCALTLMPVELTTDRDFRPRFNDAIAVAANLRDPHVLPVYEHGQIDDRLFVATRLVGGTDLRSVLRDRGRLSPARATRIVTQVAAALDDAHAADLVHHNVTPASILLPSADDDFAYLTDFWWGRYLPFDGLVNTDGPALGTVTYLAPEMFSGAAVDHRADVYALTCVYYELLVGVTPFDGDLLTTFVAHQRGTIPAPSRHGSDIPAALDPIIARGMAKDPADRYGSAGELAAAASAALAPRPTRSASVAAAPRPAPPPAPRLTARPATRPAARPAARPGSMIPNRPEQHPAAAATAPPAPPAPGEWAPPRPERRGRGRWVWGAAVGAFVLVGVATSVLYVARSSNAPPVTPTVQAQPPATSAPVTADGTPVPVPSSITNPVSTTATAGAQNATPAVDPPTTIPRDTESERRGPATNLLVLILLLVVVLALVAVSTVVLLRRRHGRVDAAHPPATPVRPPTAARTSYAVLVDGADVVLSPTVAADDPRPRRDYRVVPAIAATRIADPTLLHIRVPSRPVPGEPLRWQLPPDVRDTGRGWLDYRGPAHLRPARPGWPAGPRILHLVGNPVVTRGGLRLRIRDSGTSPGALAPQSYSYREQPPAQQTYAQEQYESRGWGQQARGTFEGEHLVGPDDLLGPATLLVVLQAEPSTEPGRSAENLRAFAGELAESGIGAVLAVPSVPDATSRSITQRVADLAGKSAPQPHPVEILDLLHAIRELVVAAVARPAEVLHELELHVPARREREQ